MQTNCDACSRASITPLCPSCSRKAESLGSKLFTVLNEVGSTPDALAVQALGLAAEKLGRIALSASAEAVRSIRAVREAGR